MTGSDKHAGHHLIETGALVEFRILDTHTEIGLDQETIAVSIDLIFTADDEDVDPREIAEWGAFGFLFVIATLSFHDARPRGYSEKDFLPDDEFTVTDFFEGLSFRQEGLHLRLDYVRGRSVKTDITVRSDGSATLTTWGRGQSALRWLDKLQGKKMIGLA